MATASQAPSDTFRFLAGGGPTADAVARVDWSATSLGDIHGWPRSLKTTVALILRSPMAMVLMWGPEGTMLYNDAYAVIAGERHPSCLGSRVRESWPEIADFNGHVLQTVLAGGTLTYRDQQLTVHRNGRAEQAWFTLDYSPAFDDEDQPAGVLAVVAETTGKVLAEQWLRSERERLRTMFEQSPGFMAMLQGPEHVVEMVNPAYLQLVGHRNVTGLAIRQALPDIAGQGYFELLDKVYRSGEAVVGSGMAVTLQRNPDGPQELRFVDFVYQPLHAPSGEVAGICVQGSDVTERMANERAVHVGEMRNRQILDSAVDYAIMAFDLEGHVTRWNEGAHRTLGWTEEEMLGNDIARIFTPEDQAALRHKTEMTLALVNGAGNDERWHIRKSGERFWANGEMTPLRDDAGHAMGFVKVLRDRTEQHRAAEALRQSEGRLRRAQAAGGVGTFTVELATNTISGTHEFFRLFGLVHTEHAPASLFEDLVLPEDAAVRSAPDTRDARTAPLDVEYRIRRASDGALRWIARKAEYETDEAGAPLRMVGVAQDVTERKDAQRSLEESAAQFRTFAQSLPNHVWTSPADGLLDWFNDRVYEYSGVQSEQLLGQGWACIVHPDDLAGAAQQWAAAVASGAQYETEFRIRRADGAYRWHLARALALRSAAGEIIRWVGTNTDIHERKVQETENVRDRDRIWRISRELMLVCDLEGRISAVNPAATRLLGWREDEMVGSSLVDFLHPEDIAATTEAIARVPVDASPLAIENRYRSRDGGYLLLNWTAVPEEGRLHAVARDVTRERMAEEALRQSLKMEAVGQLTGGIAHDFNNLLQGILGNLDVTQKYLDAQRGNEVGRFIGNAMGATRRAAALTHRLLAFSRRQPLEPRALETNPLVASMEDLLRRTLGESIRLQLALAEGLWRTKCDPNQLENAILNLAINARDAMPNGGTLVIETRNATLDSLFSTGQTAVQPGNYVCISVTDTGIGMRPDTLAKAFDPFFTTKPTGQGTGLGLSMIYGFARQSDGYARIYSEWGQGTTVKLYLPEDRSDPPADSPPATDASLKNAAPHGARATETVLVVEDQPDIRSLIVQLLEDGGYAVVEAADGNAGLAVLQSSRPLDLLITDVGLPGLNGRQLADAGRTLRPGLRVLFMTGYAENAVFASGLLDTSMTMITKPFSMDALEIRVRELLDAPLSNPPLETSAP